MSGLTFLPATRKLGRLVDNKSTWRRVFASRHFYSTDEAMLYCSALGAIVGSWMGCVCIPLDWGRAWQIWPVPNAIAASACSLLGVFVGGLIGGDRVMPIVEVLPRRLSPTKGDPKARKSTSNSPTRLRSPPRKPSSPRKDKTEAQDPRASRTPHRSSSKVRSRSTSRAPIGATSKDNPKSLVASPRRSSRREEQI